MQNWHKLLGNRFSPFEEQCLYSQSNRGAMKTKANGVNNEWELPVESLCGYREKHGFTARWFLYIKITRRIYIGEEKLETGIQKHIHWKLLWPEYWAPSCSQSGDEDVSVLGELSVHSGLSAKALPSLTNTPTAADRGIYKRHPNAHLCPLI